MQNRHINIRDNITWFEKYLMKMNLKIKLQILLNNETFEVGYTITLQYYFMEAIQLGQS